MNSHRDIHRLRTRVFSILREHVGRDNIITSAEIARQAGLRAEDASRLIRELITDALHDGTLEELELPVVAVPGSGFFVCSDLEEAEKYVDFLRILASEADRKVKAAQRLFKSFGLHIPKPDSTEGRKGHEGKTA